MSSRTYKINGKLFCVACNSISTTNTEQPYDKRTIVELCSLHAATEELLEAAEGLVGALDSDAMTATEVTLAVAKGYDAVRAAIRKARRNNNPQK